MNLSERFIKAGLTESGKIIKGKSCPYLGICVDINSRCPTTGKYDNDFSCALSRAFAIDQILPSSQQRSEGGRD